MGSFLGRWVNELGSEMIISAETPLMIAGTTLEHVRIEGTYRTRVGVENEGENFPLLGLVSDDLITFCVSYNRTDGEGEHRSLCSWAGQYLPNQRPDGTFDPADPLTTLKTIWHLPRSSTSARDAISSLTS